ncbi:GntR family transcriptional regulator [Cohnella sp. CIP 111063]|jgi:Predicted transcriptional regulators|uniref:GntR family transcriptional regulator n=1 Tax=unclassified Cohnella TaxID=2636738 RepID=UPI000B8C2E59|nr:MULTISPECIES: GntR family transcriptional regulator [unclassified Cohnella]OXS58793.1 GntR family transcriptional regulator [Cohnella sp. CIP 111063]PRX71874.1 GntR family transcriptional regulator [Cohnella sp. SGD-V74]
MNIQISNASGEPIYSQIVGRVRGAILSGELAPGTMLPSIRQLAKDLQISVITTKRAYEELEKEGLIDSVVGKGSFVSGANEAFIREQRLRAMETKLLEAVKEGKSLGLSLEEIIGHVRLLDQEGESEG